MILFNLVIAIIATAVAVGNWSDPTQQFWVGANAIVAAWCSCDILKELARD